MPRERYIEGEAFDESVWNRLSEREKRLMRTLFDASPSVYEASLKKIERGVNEMLLALERVNVSARDAGYAVTGLVRALAEVKVHDASG